jgi:hypothetical protein
MSLVLQHTTLYWDFCSDVGEKTYSREDVAQHVRGLKSFSFNSAEALFIQINEFKRLRCGGLEAKRFSDL